MFIELASRCPLIAWGLIDRIVALLSEKQRTFQLIKALEILVAIMKTSAKLINIEKDIIQSTLEKVSRMIYGILTMVATSETSGAYGVSRDRCKTLLKSVFIIVKRYQSEFEKEQYADIWKGDELLKLLETITTEERFRCNSLTNLYKQFVSILQ
jgi:hypothetical protein